MSKAEKIEFSELKNIRAKRGFWLPEEQARWDILFNKQAKLFVSKSKLGLVTLN